jgi:DNA-binding transcriptional ArsR family regulator
MTDDGLDHIFKAMAHPERRRILRSLKEQPNQSLFEICARSIYDAGQSSSRQTISQHLDMLERAGLIEISWVGRTKRHCARIDALRDAVEFTSREFL